MLHRVFAPFEVVEEVYVCEELEHVVALVAFGSRHEAAEANEELHGKNIYN